MTMNRDSNKPLSVSSAAEETGVPRPGVTFRDLLAALMVVEKPDAQFADDLEEIQAGQPLIGEIPRLPRS